MSLSLYIFGVFCQALFIMLYYAQQLDAQKTPFETPSSFIIAILKYLPLVHVRVRIFLLKPNERGN